MASFKNSSISNYAIITAGGIGSRIQTKLPKQFVMLNGQPLLAHSIIQFYRFDPEINLYVTIPDEFIDNWYAQIQNYELPAHQIITGGTTRFHSVKNALEQIHDQEGLIAVHDAARPMVSLDLMHNAFATARKRGNAVPATSVNSSIRQKEGKQWKPIDRNQLRIIQTPQVFNLQMLKRAYQVDHKSAFTDDATVYEANGNEITLLEGDQHNFKITTESDLELANHLLQIIDT
ncbi:MAG: 2-C-methyl-D-erythritol 4-phosphate cytidylyltransferase [Bacteroidetes bacterium SW_10_40_5]|nr:MAG: 2-C-methyl-D-erythritol 4-phosphate cytidylyltransferase [Bacteroidetes bacterium SW_10_40_5]